MVEAAKKIIGYSLLYVGAVVAMPGIVLMLAAFLFVDLCLVAFWRSREKQVAYRWNI